ncbi:MAG: DUF6686 family protein [Pelobium sp.]
MEDKFIELHKNDFGNVNFCHHCGCAMVAFGNLIFKVNEDDFILFIKLINQLNIKYQSKPDQHPEEKIMIQMDIPDFFIALQKNELSKLASLLNQADLMRSVHQLIYK